MAKTLNETAKRTKILSIKGGILQGAPMEAAQVVELASLPPADVLRGQVLGAIVGPLTSIVGLFAAPLQDFVGLIDARVDQLGGPRTARGGRRGTRRGRGGPDRGRGGRRASRRDSCGGAGGLRRDIRRHG